MNRSCKLPFVKYMVSFSNTDIHDERYCLKEESKMTREELKEKIDELMRQYDNEEIDGPTYAQRMMELTTSAQSQDDED